MFKLSHACQILETKKLKNSELHVDIENSSEYSSGECLMHRQNYWGFIKEGSFLKQRHVVRLGCMVLRIDEKGVSEKEVFMYVKPSTLKEDKWWSFKPRIILDYNTYSQLKDYPEQKLCPSLKQDGNSHETEKIEKTNSEKKYIGCNYYQIEKISGAKRDEIKGRIKCMDHYLKEDMFNVHPKLSHSYEDIGTQGLVKAKVQSFLSNTNIETFTKHKLIPRPSEMKISQKQNMGSDNSISRKKSFVKEKIACFEEAAILKTTPEKLSEI